jgi:hypothetical protein
MTDQQQTKEDREAADKLIADYKRRLAEAEQAKGPNPLQSTAVPSQPRY